jgi:hypothetical protein
MNTGMRIVKLTGTIVLCLGSLRAALAAADQNQKPSAPAHSQKKEKDKKPDLPPLPSGPTGPVPQVPLDSMKPVAPEVTYQNGQLTISAPNSTLGDILRAVRKQTGAEIEVPDAPERVVIHIGPGPAQEVMAELLNGSRFNYVLLGAPENPGQMTRVVLVAKTGPDAGGPNSSADAQQQAAIRRGAMAQPQPPQEMADTNDADTPPEENADDNNNTPEPAPAAEPEQPATTDPGVAKTPQQLLQEMQQRQLQMQQQQQQGGQPPNPQRPDQQ